MGCGGPVGPRNAIVVGSWWMLREMEVSTVRAAHIEFEGDWRRPGLIARLTFPTSKNDPSAFGVTRSHRCHCSSRASALCPAHALVDQVLLLARTFPEKFVNGRPALDLPLFPSQGGRGGP